MKKIIIMILIVHCTLCIENCMCQWFWQNPYPQGNWLSGTDAINSNIFYAVGKGATYIKSTDGGGSWNVKHFLNGRSANFSFIRFTNQNTGWICGDSGYIFKTTNSGNNWILQNTNIQSTFTKLFLLNENSGFAIGSGGIVIKTSNGGVNWINIGIINSSYTFYDIYFNNYSTGYVCGFNSAGPYGGSLFYKTTNSGINWTSLGLTVNNCVYFLNEQTGYASGVDSWSGHQYFYKTTNSGVNWQGTLNDNVGFQNLFFINGNTGWTNGQNGVYKTTNGSADWVQLRAYTGGTCGSISYMRFLDSNIFLGVGCSHILKSTNGGNNWAEVSKVAEREIHYQIQFINESTGWADNFFGMLKTTDAGNNWIYSEITNSREINKFHFIDNNTGWISCKYNNKYTLINTTNGGTNWSTLNLDTNNFVRQIYFTNQSTGFIHFDTSTGSPHFIKLFRTTNSGINWQQICKINSYEAGSINFINNTTGFALFKNTFNQYDYYVYKTTNAGVNWNQTGNTLLNFTANSLLFINETTGLLSGHTYNTIPVSIYKTTDGGANWQNMNLENLNLYSISKLNFVNTLTGFANGTGYLNSYALILSTTDGGQNWRLTYPGPTDAVYDIFFINSQTGWFTTGEGGIMKTTNGGSVFVSNNSQEIPNSFCLFQNYPNPFNPSTNIKYQIANNSPMRVTLKIYDILGREIETLVNEKKSPGTYEVTFDGSRLASGIYFYTLTVGDSPGRTGDFRETKKLILLK